VFEKLSWFFLKKQKETQNKC